MAILATLARSHSLECNFKKNFNIQAESCSELRDYFLSVGA